LISDGKELLAPSPNPDAKGPPLVGYPRLLNNYIHSYPSYVKAVSSATWGSTML